MADFTGDGIPDIVSGSTGGLVFLYPGNGDGTFGAGIQVLSVGLHNTYGLVSGDFNNDGKVDLVISPTGGDNGSNAVGDSELKL